MMVEAKIGLEIHGYLKMSDSKKKLFCNCAINQDASPNQNTCPICTGQPGNKPMLPNPEAVKKVIAACLMMGCKVNYDLLFQRKHYDWPDLPNGYQKTMSGAYGAPVGVNGSFLGIGIEEAHLEEDPARWDPITGKVDYNRSGFPLIEIVTKPDFKSADEVRDWVRKLLRTLGYIDAIDPNSGIKCDVNVSIAPSYVRTEVKNVNSIKAIEKSIQFEIKRQQSEEQEGMQTRAWDDSTGTTKFMRKKETIQQYMFIPEPDLPVVQVDEKYIATIHAALPEKPEEKIKKFKEMGVGDVDAQILATEIDLAELFEKVAKEIDPLLAAKWLRSELLRVLNYNEKTFKEVEADEKHIIDLLRLVQDKKVTDPVAKKLLEKLIESPFDIMEHVKSEGLEAVSDTGELEKFCKEAIEENPNAVQDYKSGEENALNFIVGQVMRKSRGKASPQIVKELVKKLIS